MKTIADIEALIAAGKREEAASALRKKQVEGVHYHHTSWHRGYVSRKARDGIVYGYRGRFGEGYAVLRPSWNSTTYCHIDYYIAD